LYRQFDCASVCNLLGITPDDVPAGLILHGTYDMPRHAGEWRDRLANSHVAANAFNLVIGEYGGVKLWYAPVLGSSMAAFITHCAAVAGVRGMVQIGSFGGTRRGMAVGDLAIITGAGRGDGASDWYLPPGAPARPCGPLTDRLRHLLRNRGLTWHEGPVYTTTAFMAEQPEDIARWEAEGYLGVEMEAATTYAVAEHFGVPSACLLYLLDNLIAERHILHNSEDDRLRLLAARALVENLALELVTTPGFADHAA
jgi:uridine phosphorylase